MTVVKVLEPTGILDGVTTNELKNQVVELVQKDTDMIVIDMKNVTFMNSSGIGALVATLKAVRGGEKSLCLCGLSDQVRMIFELTKMDRVFKTYRDFEAFEMEALKANA